ncbi:MAG TPA: L-lactate permease [Blastocatellia bacterium]|jgi:lactate permease|nr:L-lactate permease [Blastocatellia bacterium]
MNWTQVYDPLHYWPLSTLVAAIPIVVLFYLLAVRGTRPHRAAMTGAISAIILASAIFTMPPAMAVMSFAFGVAFGLKIAWIVVAAVFLYDISVFTGQFEIMKNSVAAISQDRRLQALLVAFAFGAFVEGCAGFGAPVAISGAFMIGLGFDPFYAAVLNLIANTAPVAWGSIGTPIHTLAAVTGMNESDLSAMAGRILPITSVIVPIWLVRVMAPWRATLEVMPAILVCGVSFAVTQFIWSNYVDSNLVDIASAAACIVSMLVFLRFWQPKNIWRFAKDEAATTQDYTRAQITKAQVLRAWMPFAILTVFVMLWGLPSIKNALNRATTPSFAVTLPDGKPRSGPPGWDVPMLHNQVFRDKPVVADRAPEAARYDFNWLTMTGTAAFLAAIVSGLLLGLRPAQLLKIFGGTLKRMRFAVLAIVSMLGLGFVTRYSGMDAVLGLAFTRTGWLFPFFGTFLGWLGVALTGSDTSSNALFGSLQRITAQQLNIDPVLMTAANSAGGVMGKMVDAQSIVVATAATNQVGSEGKILRAVVRHSIALAAIVGLIVMLFAYVFKSAVPHGLDFVK